MNAFKLIKLFIILVLLSFTVQAKQVEANKKSNSSLSSNKLKVEKNFKQLSKSFAADLYKTDYFKSSEGKNAKNLLLKVSNGDFNLIENTLTELKAASSKKDPHAIAWLGFMHQLGAGSLSVDLEKAVELFEQSAKLNDPFALFNLGLFHEKGRYGFSKDKGLANHYYKESIKYGGHRAYQRYGDAHRDGNIDLGIIDLGIIQDVEKAVSYYQKSEDRGSLLAKVSLSNLYQEGELSLPLNLRLLLAEKHAKELCNIDTRFAAKGCVLLAQALLREINGFVLEEEKESEILGALEKAMRKDALLADAPAILALIHGENNSQFRASNEQIKQWFELGCPEDDPDIGFDNQIVGSACLAYGNALQKANLFWINHVDLEKSIKFYKRGVRENHGGAYASLGFSYLQGSGVRIDTTKGAGLIKLSAIKFENVNGMQMLSTLYTTGNPVEKDLGKAQLFRKKAALRGFVPSMELYARGNIADLETEKIIAQPNYEECFLWSYLSRLRNSKDKYVYPVCQKKISQEKRVQLIQRANELHQKLPRY